MVIFNKRKIIYKRTSSLVRNSKLVIGHYSLAINFAIFYKKPILLFLTQSIIDNGNDGYIKSFSKSIGINYYDISKENFSLSKKDIFNIKINNYEKYIESYVKSKDTIEAPIWDVIISKINSLRL